MRQGGIFIIAEAGVNHDGNWERAIGLIDAAAVAGADAVKFQTFDADALVSVGAPKAAYQLATTCAEESQRAMLKRLELPASWHRKRIERARERGLVFLSTPFDLASFVFLAEELGLDLIKLGSGELTNAPLLYRAGRSGKRLILSTGMGTVGEIRAALAAIACGSLGAPPGGEAFAHALDCERGRQALAERVSLMHCVRAYHAP